MASLIMTAGLDPCCEKSIADRFKPPRYKVSQYTRTGAIERRVRCQTPAVVIVGTRGRRFDEGLPSVRRIRSIDRRLPIIFVSRESSETRAVAAFRAGVRDYFKAPVSHVRLCDSINRLMDGRGLPGSAGCPETDDNALELTGDGDVMKALKNYLMRVAAAPSTVLLTGETGTGKELAATMIHRYSSRADRPLICINCAAIPETLVESELFGHIKGAFTGAVAARKGAFEMAAGGTLFLDEIGDMGAYPQAKILRSLESKKVYPVGAHKTVPVDVRIIAATNNDPEAMIRAGQFRSDLFYRLNVIRVQLPPLRERKEDLPQLAAQAIKRLNAIFDRSIQGLSGEVMTALLLYDWPGNVRELNNLLEAAFVSCRSRKIEFVDLPPTFTKRINFVDAPHISDRDKLLTVLTSTNWNKTAAAKKLNWSRMRVYRALKRYHIAITE